MSKIVISHWESTSMMMHATGSFLKKYEIPILAVPRSKEILGLFAVEFVDGILREISNWLPSPKVDPGLLSLMRLMPELRPISGHPLFHDYSCDVLESYRQQLHDAFMATNIDWAWAEYKIVKFDERSITVEYLGDRRILEWERSNKIKEIAHVRANYAAGKTTICYPNGFLRD